MAAKRAQAGIEAAVKQDWRSGGSRSDKIARTTLAIVASRAIDQAQQHIAPPAPAIQRTKSSTRSSRSAPMTAQSDRGNYHRDGNRGDYYRR
jgi:hypothetical protein